MFRKRTGVGGGGGQNRSKNDGNWLIQESCGRPAEGQLRGTQISSAYGGYNGGEIHKGHRNLQTGGGEEEGCSAV